MDWRALPSLSALRAFEAAARCGSLSAAARELNVTHAAIAQHLRTLEDHFGLTLMERSGKAMVVTDAARDLATALSAGFGQIAAAARDLALRDACRPLRVALTPSFAGNWLMPRIGGFWAAHPEIPLDLSPGMALVDLRRDGFDIAIRYGRGGWPGVAAQRLVAAGHCVVAAPGLVAGRNVAVLGDLADLHWLMERNRTEERMWAMDNGLNLEKVRVTGFDTGMMAYHAVIAGHGVSIMPHAVVERDIAAGRLVALFRDTSDSIAYHILTRPDRVSPQVRTFVRWLKDQAREQT